MKDFRGMKRQRSRNRKPSGNSNNPNRAYESNGPDGVKVRGNAQTIYEKYQQLARDANSSGDRVLAENHLQHAEHYFRLIRQMQPQRPVSEFVQRDPFSNGYDDFDDEIDNEAAPETETVEQTEAQGETEARDNRERNDRNRDRNRDRNDNRERNFQRDPQRDGQRSDQRPDAREDENGNRRETRRERYERRRAQRLQDQEKNLNGEDDAPLPAYASPSAIASTEPLGAPKPAPQNLVSEAPAQEPDVSHLPAFLRAPTPAVAATADEAAEEAPAKPKRGRRKKTEEVSAEEA